MLDIIGIILAWQNGKKAAERGHSKGMWILASLGLWFGGEIGGVLVGAMLLGNDPHTGKVNLVGAAVIGLVCAVIGGIIAWNLVNRLSMPAWMSPAPGFMPTHSVPAGGLPVTDAPDPTRPVVGVIPQFEPLMVIAVAGDWVQVRASNGWIGWADGRILNGRAWAQLGSAG